MNHVTLHVKLALLKAVLTALNVQMDMALSMEDVDAAGKQPIARPVKAKRESARLVLKALLSTITISVDKFDLHVVPLFL